MNVLFLNPYPEDGSKSNLFRKFSSQIKCAAKVSDHVYYTSYDRKKIYINEYGNSNYKKSIGMNYPINKNVIVMHNMMRHIKKWIRNKKIDIVYIRNNPATYTHKKALRKISNSGAYVVVEIPTYPGLDESKNSSRKVFYFFVNLFTKLFQSAYDRYTNLYALVGEKAESYHGIPAINIENGIDVELVPMKKGFQDHPDELHLLLVAVISYWHGFDRLIKGVVSYSNSNLLKQKKKICVHICGNSPDGSLDTVLEIAKKNGIENSIIYHGFLSGTELNELYDKCDVAIGSLGLFRQNIIIDTTLKLTEYTARGIPFIYCTESKNVEKNSNYALRVSEDEKPIDIQNIIEFFEKIDKKSISNQMRQYAQEKLDWSIQFQKIINKINEFKLEDKRNG